MPAGAPAGFTLRGKIALDGAPMKKALDQLHKETKSFAQKIKGQFVTGILGGIGLNALKGVASELIKNAEQAQRLGRQLNLSSDNLQRLKMAADQTGLSFEDMVSELAGIEDEAERANRLAEALERAGTASANVLSADKIEGLRSVGNFLKEWGQNLVIWVIEPLSKLAGAIKNAVSDLVAYGGGIFFGGGNDETARKVVAENQRERELRAKAARDGIGLGDSNIDDKRNAEAKLKVEDEASKKREAEDKRSENAQEKLNKILFDRLSNEEKILDLRKQIIQTHSDEHNAFLRDDKAGELEALVNRLEAEDKIAELSKLKPEKEKAKDRFEAASDSLSRIGGFLGGTSSFESIAKRQLAEIKRTNEQLRSGIRVKDL